MVFLFQVQGGLMMYAPAVGGRILLAAVLAMLLVVQAGALPIGLNLSGLAALIDQAELSGSSVNHLPEAYFFDSPKAGFNPSELKIDPGMLNSQRANPLGHIAIVALGGSAFIWFVHQRSEKRRWRKVQADIEARLQG